MFVCLFLDQPIICMIFVNVWVTNIHFIQMYKISTLYPFFTAFIQSVACSFYNTNQSHKTVLKETVLHWTYFFLIIRRVLLRLQLVLTIIFKYNISLNYLVELYISMLYSHWYSQSKVQCIIIKIYNAVTRRTWNGNMFNR